MGYLSDCRNQQKRELFVKCQLQDQSKKESFVWEKSRSPFKTLDALSLGLVKRPDLLVVSVSND
jgi:hypothetical protein